MLRACCERPELLDQRLDGLPAKQSKDGLSRKSLTWGAGGTARYTASMVTGVGGREIGRVARLAKCECRGFKWHTCMLLFDRQPEAVKIEHLNCLAAVRRTANRGWKPAICPRDWGLRLWRSNRPRVVRAATSGWRGGWHLRIVWFWARILTVGPVGMMRLRSKQRVNCGRFSSWLSFNDKDVLQPTLVVARVGSLPFTTI
jgi:hypothetical protein